MNKHLKTGLKDWWNDTKTKPMYSIGRMILLLLIGVFVGKCVIGCTTFETVLPNTADAVKEKAANLDKAVSRKVIKEADKFDKELTERIEKL